VNISRRFASQIRLEMRGCPPKAGQSAEIRPYVSSSTSNARRRAGAAAAIGKSPPERGQKKAEFHKNVADLRTID